MNEIEPKEKNKKAIANEIVIIFKKIKLSIFIGIVFFIGFSIYNNLVSYTFFDKDFTSYEAEEILGYKPSQYNFIPDKIEKKTSSKNKDSKGMKIFKAAKQKILKENAENGIESIENNVILENEITRGSLIISQEGRIEVKNQIKNKLLEESSIYTLIMILVTFGILLLSHYIKNIINWTKKYAD